MDGEPGALIDALRQTLNAELPITRHLGVRVVQGALDRVILAAPLAENKNHMGTAFGGSLNAVATLAAWAWFWVFLEERCLPAEVVVQDSTIRFNRPVTTDFRASCAAPAPATISHFLEVYRRAGRGRLTLHVDISDHLGVAAAFSGRFVAVKTGAAPDAATTSWE